MPNAIEHRLDAARSLVAPLLAERGTLGAYLYGSSVRPHAHAASDLDIQLVVDDERFAAIEPAKRHTTLHHSGVKAADIWILSARLLGTLAATPTSDNTRRRLATCIVLHDPEGAVARLVGRAAEVPDAVRDGRMRLHYFEVTNLAKRVQVAERRGRADIVRILTAELVLAASKLLFLERRQWPAPVMWMSEELVVAGVPAELVAALDQVVETPAAKALRGLRGHLDTYLLERGVDFVRDPAGLWAWLWESPRGAQVRDTWGGESIRR